MPDWDLVQGIYGDGDYDPIYNGISDTEEAESSNRYNNNVTSNKHVKPIKDNFTEEQRKLIQFCKNTGYGWAKFAISVENQGWCSRKQEIALRKMKNKIYHHHEHNT